MSLKEGEGKAAGGGVSTAEFDRKLQNAGAGTVLRARRRTEGTAGARLRG